MSLKYSSSGLKQKKFSQNHLTGLKGLKRDALGSTTDLDEHINEKISQGMKNVMQVVIQKLITLVDEKVQNKAERD